MDTQNARLVILPVHMDVPCGDVPAAQVLQDCEFRMHVMPEDPRRHAVSISGGLERTGTGYLLYGYFGADQRRRFEIPIDASTSSGEVEQLFAAVLAPA